MHVTPIIGPTIPQIYKWDIFDVNCKVDSKYHSKTFTNSIPVQKPRATQDYICDSP